MRIIPFKQLFFALFIFANLTLTAQFSKTHYIPPFTCLDNSNAMVQNQYLYISTPSTTPVKFTIKAIGGATTSHTATKTNPYRHSVGSGDNTQLFINENSSNRVQSNKGYIIEADDLIYVTVKMLGGSGNPQAGSLVSKGLAGLGKTFRTGGFNNPITAQATLSFISVMATENNTVLTFSDLPAGISLINVPSATIRLNNGQSFVVAARISDADANRDGFLGALVQANKPIAVNCGSTNGTNANGDGRDYGFDQIVPIERTGTEYIFTRAFGNDDMENAMIVAHENNTEVYIQDQVLPFATLNAGEYISIEGDKYSTTTAGGNLYVRTSKNAYAYQSVGGTTNSANQGLFFVPPLNCETPNIVDNIPNIEEIGSLVFTGGLSVLAEKGASLKINNIDIGSLGAGITVTGPSNVKGNANYVTYLIEGLTGNVTVESTKQVYVAAFGTNGSAAFGGYYSGFPFKPEVFIDSGVSTTSGCLPNVVLKLNAITPYDTYQWYKNGVKIIGANSISYKPTEPGNYQVEGTILCSSFSLLSDDIPVSNCPEDDDKDGIINNIDIDYDNDGILNCSESYGEENFNLTNPTSGSLHSGLFTYTGSSSTKNTAATSPFRGNNDGRFTLTTPAGVTNTSSYEMNFNQPLNIKIQYPLNSFTANDQLSSDEVITILAPVDKNITIYNPDNQLLIDTNYDGIFESDVKQFSGFDVRFVSNSTALNFGAGTFSISAFQINSIKITLKNNSDTATNLATLQISASCLEKDSDGDGIVDYFDLDSDNDGIPDSIENFGNTTSPNTTDSNSDGLYDFYATSSQKLLDTDFDGIPNYLDLDSDNDGIYDLTEANSTAIDLDRNGVIDGLALLFGNNGLFNAFETLANNGILNYSLADSNSNTIPNAFELDSDGDLCFDVIEAGFTDGNLDGYLGNGAPVVNANGIVTSSPDGYTNPNADYTNGQPITITKQPVEAKICETLNTSFSIESNTNEIQWQISTNGVAWTDLTDDAVYSGTKTNTLNLTSTPLSLNNSKIRASLTKAGNTCGLVSNEVLVTVYQNPPAITFNIQAPLCTNSGNVQLIATPTGGIFSGTGVTNTGIFNPNTASVGTHTITYTTTNANSCTISKSIEIIVNDIPDLVQTDATQTFCSSATVIPTISNLVVKNQGTNSIKWYENAIGGAALATSEELIHNKDYFASFENGSNCTSTSRVKTTVVISKPIITSPKNEICVGESTLLTVNENFDSLIWGYYNDSNDEVTFLDSGKTLNAVPTKTTTYFVKTTVNGIQCKDEFIVKVNPLPVVTLANQAPLCISESAIQLNGLPVGGTYSGAGVTASGIFTPSLAKEGTHSIVYEYSDVNSCKASANISIIVNPLPVITFTQQNPLCIDATPVQLIATPNGGTFNGNGVNATGLFDPSISKEGTHTITYLFTDSKGCSTTKTVDITVNPLPIITITPQAPICVNANPVQLQASPSGGVFSGTGVSATGLFNPQTATIGTHTITYKFTDANSCSNSNSIDIVVNALGVVTIEPQNPLCVDAAPVQLTASPIGGVFSGIGTSNTGIFSPNTAGVGTHTITYTYTDTNSCSAINTLQIKVNSLPVITFTQQNPLCIDAAPVQLIATPNGGTFSGNGVNATGLFDPSISKEGTHTITYLFTDSNGCSATKTMDITVNPLPIITITPQAPICVNANPVQLQASPSGGVFSGNGVSATGLFNPQTATIGTHTITYKFTDANSCSSSNSIDIVVNALEVVTIEPQNPLCIDAAPVQLIASPVGGVFSGIGTSNTGIFSPNTAGAGTHTITYTYTDTNSCIVTNTVQVKVNPLPVITFTPQNALCIDAAPVQLIATPSGGTFSGNGVNATGLFDPNISTVGTHTIIYSFVDVNSCSASKSINIVVNPLPVVTINNPSNLCISEAPIQLIGSPIGGIFTGNGISSAGIFNPSLANAGTHTLTYTYKDANNCSNFASTTITVFDLPILTFTKQAELCVDENSVQLIASPSGGTFSGVGVNASGIFDPKTANSGNHTITYTYTDGNSCQNTIQQIIKVNPLPVFTVKDGAICIGDAIDLKTWITYTTSDILSIYLTQTDAENGTNELTNTTVNPIASQNYFVKVTQNTSLCTDIKTIHLTVNPLPELTTTNIVQCDEDTDGITVFNLKVKESFISVNHTNEVFTYYTTLAGAETADPGKIIIDPTAYTNKTAFTDKVWVRVTTKNACKSVVEIELKVTTSALDASLLITYESCDDYLDIDGNNSTNNNDTDGISSFNFSDAEAIIRAELPAGENYVISYYRNEKDGLAETNPIADIANYRNKDAANLQNIWVRVDSETNNECYGLGAHIQLKVNPVPVFNTVSNVSLCDDDRDGFVNGFNLENQTNTILGSQSATDYTVTYYTSALEATSGNNPLASPFTNTVKNLQKIYVRIQNNTTNCYNAHGSFELIVNSLPTVETTIPYEVCDDIDGIEDGITKSFDLASKIQTILGNSQLQANYTVSFHTTKSDADSNANAIPAGLYQNEIAWSQVLNVRIENKLTGCISTDGTLQLIVNKKPNYTVNPNQVLCIDNAAGLKLEIESEEDDYDYVWFLDNKEVGQGKSIQIAKGGTYTVTATIPSSPSCPVSKEIIVIESNRPTLVDFKVNDGENRGSILVIVAGVGDYEYQLDNESFQDEPLLQNISSGIHSISVNDKNGCGSIQKGDITILNFQKYFTPNGDSYNAQWTMDLDPAKAFSYIKGKVQIYDRMGNLLKTLNLLSNNPSENSWDGTFNGKILPATDYWFSLELTDKFGLTIVRTGHFSLIR